MIAHGKKEGRERKGFSSYALLASRHATSKGGKEGRKEGRKEGALSDKIGSALARRKKERKKERGKWTLITETDRMMAAAAMNEFRSPLCSLKANVTLANASETPELRYNEPSPVQGSKLADWLCMGW